jgi:hypothetical protein
MEPSDDLRRFALTIPVPAGLRERGPEDSVHAGLKKILEGNGTLISCYCSDETVRLAVEEAMADTKPGPLMPLHSAFALYVRGGNDYRFDALDVEKLKEKAKREWRNYKSVDGHQRDSYRNYVNRLLNASRRVGVEMDLYDPILIEFDESVENQYVVITVRERMLTYGGRKFCTTKVEATCILHTDDLLLRINYAREMRNPDDIGRTRDALHAWLRDIKIRNMI